ncbi:MAG: STAS domain-containing protein [Sporichthyaceae bacterium]
MDLQLSTRPLDGRALVTVGGELDLETSAQLGDHALCALREVSPHLALALGAVTFMDSTGLKILLAIQQRADLAGGSLALVGATRTVRRILELTGLDQAFAQHESLDDLPKLSGGAAPTT